MLRITVPGGEKFNEIDETFINANPQTLQLEHSLVSLSKWEAKWCKPFLVKGEKTKAESLDYIRCMTITQNIDPMVYLFISPENMHDVATYIELPMTATTFANNDKKSINREIITAEIIYYWMITLQIPFECEKWHLNRLITLINVCNIKNQPAKKMSSKEAYASQRELNKARRAKYGTTG
jgi:hypothetical protein